MPLSGSWSLALLFLLQSPLWGSATNPCLLDQGWVTKVRAQWNMTSHREHIASTLPNGPYQVKTDTIANIPGLTKGGPYSAYIVYAVPKSDGEKLPFISFSHGVGAGGARLLAAYKTDLELVASYGFVIVAAESCPTSACASGYCVDQQATIRACVKDPSLHPALASADFSKVGVYGHSMGAMATLGSVGGAKACKEDDTLNIKAAVSQHPCSDAYENAAPIKVPILFTAGSIDNICQDGCAQKFFNQITKSPSKIMFDVKGATHFNPSSDRGGTCSEVPAVAYFFSCWLRDENCDKVYGSSGKAICDVTSTSECTVVGTKKEERIVV